MDMPSHTTVASTSSGSVPLKSTGHGKNHFIAILTAKADGTKIKPLILLNTKHMYLIKDIRESLVPYLNSAAMVGCTTCSL